jgi:hypothetical protein
MTEIKSGDDVGDDEQSVLSLGVKAIDCFFFERCPKGSPRSVLPDLEDGNETPPRIEVFRMEE